MYINAVADSVILYLLHDFHNIMFTIKHKLYTASGSAPPPQRKILGVHLLECVLILILFSTLGLILKSPMCENAFVHPRSRVEITINRLS
jgi:hypothetical protein